jgi:hypothetical protein
LNSVFTQYEELSLLDGKTCRLIDGTTFVISQIPLENESKKFLGFLRL